MRPVMKQLAVFELKLEGTQALGSRLRCTKAITPVAIVGDNIQAAVDSLLGNTGIP